MLENFNWNIVPGADLMRQAWDATKLAGAIMRKNKEKAVVLATEQHAQVAKYKGKQANKKLKELWENQEYYEVVRLFVPDTALTFVEEAKDTYFRIWDLYWILCILRVFLVFTQHGYLHPDEYFQTTEVVTGDVYDLEVTRTWEFNVTNPIRSMVIPNVLYASPFYLIKGLNYILWHYTGLNVINGFILSTLPRLTMLVLSFITDICLYKICVLYKHSYNRCLTTLASSYVMLVFANKTLTNSIELALMSLLLYMVAHCMKRTSETVYLQSMVQEAYVSAETIAEKVKVNRKKKFIPPHDFKFFLHISILVVAGFFNRPTFLIFACVPMFYWFQRGVALDSQFTPFVMFNFRMASLVPGALVTFGLFVLLDSLYYGELTLWKLWELEMDWSDWKVAPLQFILYNVVPGNLDKHGTHPHYLHALVNLPLLYGPLGVIALVSAFNFLSEMIMYEWHKKPGVRTVYALTTFTFMVSLGLLSVVPHQEPRFLIPLTLPIVITNAHLLRFKVFGYKPLMTLWYVFNFAMVIFYGHFHQAGVTPTLSKLRNDLVMSDRSKIELSSEVNFVFSHTYMPPKFFLMQGEFVGQQAPYLRSEVGPSNPRKFIHDLAGGDLDLVEKKLVDLGSRVKYLSSVKNIENYLVIPYHLGQELAVRSKGDLTLTPLWHVTPHVTTEAIPDPTTIFEALSDPRKGLSEVWNYLGQFSLTTYKVEMAASEQSAAKRPN